MKTFPILYKRAKTKAIQTWQVFVEGDSFYTIAGQLGGSLTKSLPTVCKPKNLNKANATTSEEQAEIEAQAKFDKKLKENYFENVKDIDNFWLEPQLCKLYRDYKDKIDWSKGWIVDEKLNGACCLITKNGARTRKNKEYLAIPHILEELKPFFEKYPDAYLHGELFNPNHVNELNEIIKLISVNRNEKDITPDLLERSKNIIKLFIYDGYGFGGLNKKNKLIDRREFLDWNFKNSKYIVPVNWKRCFSEAEMMEYAEDYIGQGGEGVVVKNPDTEYKHQSRSKETLKYKKMIDAEFEVVELLEGNGNWTGAAKMATCKLPNGQTFDSNIEGTMEYLRDVWKRKNEWEGQKITVRFQEMSPLGKPLIPYTDLVIRNYE